MLDNEQTLDYIFLEATGLADPGNILRLIQDPEGLGKRLFVNNVITVVDAKNIHRSLSEPVHLDPQRQDIGNPAAARVQLKYADIVILNKIDLVSPHQVEEAKADIAIVNPDATMHITTYSEVPKVVTAISSRRRASVSELPSAAPEISSSHLDPVSTLLFILSQQKTSYGYSHFLQKALPNKELIFLQQMTTISVPLPILSPDQAIRFESWIRSMLWDTVFSDTIQQHYRLPSTQTTSLQIHRIKGRISLSDGSSRTMQGVREGFEVTDCPSSAAVIGLTRRNKSGNGNELANKSRPAYRRSVSDVGRRNYSRSDGSTGVPVYQRSISPFSGKKSRSKSYERPQFKQSGTSSLPGKIVLIGRGLAKEQFQRSMGAHVLSVA